MLRQTPTLNIPASFHLNIPTAMKTLKHILSLLILTWAVCALTACGGDDDPLRDPGYNIDLPQTAHDKAGQLTTTPLTEAEKAELEAQGLKFVGTPVHITLGDQEHVFLQEHATVTFDIPADIPQEDYDNLLGVSIAEGHITYMTLDPEQLQKGKAVFKAAHFSDEGLVLKSDEELLEVLAPRIAANGYQKRLRDADLQKSFREQLEDKLSTYGLGKNDLFRTMLRKAAEENEYTAEIVELANSENLAEDIAQRSTERMAEKALETLFAAWQDQRKQSTGSNKDSEVVKALESHLTVGNVQDWATKLGSGTSPSELAKEYAKEVAVNALKDYTTDMLPVIKAMQAEARAIKALRDFWVDNTIEEGFQAYQRLSPDRNGRISDDDWNGLAGTYMAAAIRQHRIDGKMSEAQIRALFEQRVKDRDALREEEAKVARQFKVWKEAMLLKRGFARFGKTMELTTRVAILNNLTERFRKEFTYRGSIPRKGDWTNYKEDRLLAEIVYQYLNFFPDTRKFYAWARQQGFYGDRLQRTLAELNKDGAWHFVEVELYAPQNTNGVGNPWGHWETYKISENQHTHTSGSNYHAPESATITSTCTSPPKTLHPGDVVIIHTTNKVVSGVRKDYTFGRYSYATFRSAKSKADLDRRAWSGAWSDGTVENLKSPSTKAEAHESATPEQRSSEYDIKLVIPTSSSKAVPWSVINFTSTIGNADFSCETKWIYEWRGLLE